MTEVKKNTEKNKLHYDNIYSKLDINHIIKFLNNFDYHFNDACNTDTSWVGFYVNNFSNNLKNKKILELGCGDCKNLAVMAYLGADVYGNDISQESGRIIKKINEKFSFKYPIKFVAGDFLESPIRNKYYDYIVGKAFIHHLTPLQEIKFTEKIVKELKENGRVRYFEPAVNSKFFDTLRWIVPVPGRPSILNRNKFKKWKELDPHPERDNSEQHYKQLGAKFFEKTTITPIGGLERFARFFNNNRKLRRFLFKLESFLPTSFHVKIARSQTIDYFNPKK